MKPLYFKDGTQFSTDYVRVVHGGRGDYVELSKDQILVELKSHFNQPLPLVFKNETFYYYWVEPIGRIEKIYWQIKPVDYADYVPGMYYIHPSLLKDFEKK